MIIRKFVYQLSVIVNLIFLLYVCTLISSRNGVKVFLDKLQTNSTVCKLTLEEVEEYRRLKSSHMKSAAVPTKVPFLPGVNKVGDQLVTSVVEDKNSAAEVETESRAKSLKKLIACHDRDALPYTAQRGDFWVFYNYVVSKRRPHCWESITYTTHADHTFLDNLIPVMDRWRGPLSLALYAPGTDFEESLNIIRYLRKCGTQLVKDYVTFHIYFPSKHIPKNIPHGDEILEAGEIDCALPAPWLKQFDVTYRKLKKLPYMINVGRNIARESATTHYVVPLDLELYPSPGLIPKFFDMLLRQEAPLLTKNPKVFVLPIFEVKSDMHLPERKSELVKMLRDESAIPFHKFLCPSCHTVPKSDEWINTTASEDGTLKVFHIAKRSGNWEPFYIGTNQEIPFDERIAWEGKGDKMPQAYTLCVLDYDLLILDSAFLVHKPGIKTDDDPSRLPLIKQNRDFINNVIYTELKLLFGAREECTIYKVWAKKTK